MSGARTRIGRPEGRPIDAEKELTRAYPDAPTTLAGRVSVRTHRRYRPRPTTFGPWPATVAELLDRYTGEVGTHRFYGIGGRPGGIDTAAGVAAWAAGPLPEGWTATGHYLRGDMPALHYRHAGGPALDVMRAAVWFDDRDRAADLFDAAWQVLAREVAATFDDGAVLATPGATGRYLWQRCIGWDDHWPVLAADLQNLIRSVSGQGRTQIIDPGRTDPLPRLVEYDGRFMYAALCRDLRGGQPEHLTAAGGGGLELDPYTRGMVRVAFTVPAGWDLPGILPVAVDGGGWDWPTAGGGETWADAAEVRLGRLHRWPVTIREAIVWPSTRSRDAGPLDTWAAKLVRIRGRLLASHRAASSHGADAGEPYELAAMAVRAILTHGIGALYGRGNTVTQQAASAGEVATRWDAATCSPVVPDPAGGFTWQENRGQADPDTAHPEWCAAIWGRCRARLLDAPTSRRGVRAGMLHLPPGSVVATRTDALYLTTDPHWPDEQQRVGHFRRVHTWPGPITPPATNTDLLRLKGT